MSSLHITLSLLSIDTPSFFFLSNYFSKERQNPFGINNHILLLEIFFEVSSALGLKK